MPDVLQVAPSTRNIEIMDGFVFRTLKKPQNFYFFLYQIFVIRIALNKTDILKQLLSSEILEKSHSQIPLLKSPRLVGLR